MDMKKIASFGVAGNFTGHLEQAGEASDFTQVKAAPNAPKAIFPTYLPGAAGAVPEFLGVYPFDEEKIIFPKGEQKLQIEPECALIFQVQWAGEQIAGLRPLWFGASNDCSIRKQGAKKISEKKNWGASTKGFALSSLLPVDSFTSAGVLARYRIASFLVREGQVHPYGEDSAIRDYSYIYDTLLDWMLEKLNCQQDEGPAEHIHAYLNAIGRPEQIMISIGATRYTAFGEHNFLQEKDEAVVVVYPEDRYTGAEIREWVRQNKVFPADVSLLRQRVVME